MRLIRLMLALSFALLFVVPNAWAATYSVTCSGDITPALNDAIKTASSGDTISISAGTCSSGSVTVTDKQLTIQGQGQAVTNVTANSLPFIHFLRNNSNNANSRLSGMTVTGSQTSGSVIHVNGQYGNSGTDDGWRIDRLTLNFPGLVGTGIFVDGPTWGLIDNNTITIYNGFGINLEAVAMGESNYTGDINHLWGQWLLSQPLEPGSRHAVYVEDNTFTFSVATAVFDTNNCGSRIVFRNNLVTNGVMYAHWTRSWWINGFWFEVYNNRFVYNLAAAMFPGRFEGGTGLIYNNTFIGYSDTYIVLNDPRGDKSQSDSSLLLCDGTHNWDGNAGDNSAPGWPCLGQVGRASGKSFAQIQAGDKPASFPFYSWSNGAQDKCYNPAAAGSACTNTVSFTSWTPNYVKSTAHTVTGGGYGQGDVDFCSNATQPVGCGTHTLTYVPLKYPHPLQTGTSTLSPPSLRIAP